MVNCAGFRLWQALWQMLSAKCLDRARVWDQEGALLIVQGERGTLSCLQLQ